MLRDLWRDAVRACRADKWTSVTIVATLAAGTGFNAAVLALGYGILLRPLPYQDPGRLVVIEREIRLGQLPDWTTRLQTVDEVSAFATASHVLRGVGTPRVVKAAFVSEDFFDLLGVAEARGRRSDGRLTGAFLSQRTLRSAGIDPTSVAAQTVSIAGLTLPILGILPDDVAFPAEGTELWIPAGMAPAVTLKGPEDARGFRCWPV